MYDFCTMIVVQQLNSDMEYVFEHFKTNSQLYKAGLQQVAKAAIGIVMVGISLGCIHLVIFLVKVLRLPKNSRQYAHKSEYVEGDALVRNMIMITCVFVVDWLILVYFESGPRIMLIGAAAWTIYFSGKYLYNLTKNYTLKQQQKQKQ